MTPRVVRRVDPTLDAESALFAAGASVVIGCDEVGRGAIAGPVTVGMALLTALPSDIPDGLRDSKLMTPKARERTEPVVAEWVEDAACGSISASDIDAYGIMWALGEAGWLALNELTTPLEITSVVVILDGAYDWLSPALRRHDMAPLPVVRVRPKADRDCAVVSAASVIAKVRRDAAMCELASRPEYAKYGWASNKGYGSAAHRAAIAAAGPSDLHRLSWLHPSASKERLG